jgi:hypothetical protein
MKNSAEQLFQIFSHPNFLAMKGLANEVPMFIQTYPPGEEDKTELTIANIAARLKKEGIPVAVIDLFELVLDLLSASDLLDRAIEKEPTLTKRKMLEMLNNVADPETRLIPHLSKIIGAPDIKISLIKGVGHLYPFLRTHTILESLQPAMMNHPVVMFFPGEYIHEENGASHLRLFGQLTESTQSHHFTKPYYRAVNLDHYRIIQ